MTHNDILIIKLNAISVSFKSPQQLGEHTPKHITDIHDRKTKILVFCTCCHLDLTPSPKQLIFANKTPAKIYYCIPENITKN